MWEGKERDSFFLTCREGEWKWAPYRMKASEDDPLTMKFDDPRSPSDAHRAQLNIALGLKPPSLQREKDSRVCAYK